MATVCIPEDEIREAVDNKQVFADILGRVRSELGDFAHPFSIELVGDGHRTHFRLEHRPVDLPSVVIDLVEVGLDVPEPPPEVPELPPALSFMANDFSKEFTDEYGIPYIYVEETGAELPFEPVRRWRVTRARSDYDDGVNFFQIGVGVYIDVPAGQVVFDTAPNAGSIYRVEGRKFRYFTDAEYQRFMETAAAQLGHNRSNSAGNPWTIENITPVEEYPLAILATIQALWALATDASFDIDILAPDGVNIPRSERFRQLMQMIGARQTQYDELAQALNIGLMALETLTTRRVAKSTNRLVPVHLSQEFDDSSRPKRVILEQNLLGTTAVKTMVGAYDIDLYSGYPWYTVIDLGCDISAGPPPRPYPGLMPEDAEPVSPLKWVPEAMVRRARGASFGAPLRHINAEVIDAKKGLILLSLTARDTRRLPYNAFWELQLRPDDGGEPLPVLGGMIRSSITEVVR